MRAFRTLLAILLVAATPVLAQDRADLSWVIRERPDGSGNPRSGLDLKVGDRTVPIRRDQPLSYSPIAPGDWSVPADAEAAVLGWWAGSGEVLYARRVAGIVEVYLGAVEEEGTGPVFAVIRRVDVE